VKGQFESVKYAQAPKRETLVLDLKTRKYPVIVDGGARP
jgi:hypothetical protein